MASSALSQYGVDTRTRSLIQAGIAEALLHRKAGPFANCDGPLSGNHSALNASIGSRFAARWAGRIPARSPMEAASTSATAT